MRVTLAAAALALLMAGCVSPDTGGAARAETTESTDAAPTSSAPTTSSTTTTTTLSVPAPPEVGDGTVCDLYSARVEELGMIDNDDIREASGIAASRRTPGAYWVINDSGNDPVAYAVDDTGATIAAVAVEGVLGFDWEAIAVGPGPEPGVSYLYIGDIGDNLRLRSTISLHRFPEPDLGDPPAAVGEVATLRLSFPEEARDSEAMWVDPITADVFVVTKRQRNGKAVVLRATADALEGAEPAQLERVAEFRFEEGVFVTAADVTSDGSVVALRGYEEVWMWVRTDLDYRETFAADPCMAPSPSEIQGEALAFVAEGLGYVTLSEGADKPLNFVAP